MEKNNIAILDKHMENIMFILDKHMENIMFILEECDDIHIVYKIGVEMGILKKELEEIKNE